MSGTYLKELQQFKHCHKNTLNIFIHILCGCLYLSFLFACLKDYAYYGIMLYMFVVYVFTHDSELTLIIGGFLYCITTEILKSKFQTLTALTFATIFYFLPEIGHIITGEKIAVEIFALEKRILNVLLLLPFSLLSLSA